MKKIIILLLMLSFNAFASINQPVAVDSRIKTLIYSPNEVFQLKFIVGYQSIIELESDESIELVSFGDPLPWSMKVFNKRIFIKAMDPGVKTNFTIITNKRTYLTEISSSNLEDESFDDQLVYIVRFMYPEIDIDTPKLHVARKPNLNASLPQPNQNKSKERTLQKLDGINFQYTFAGTGDRILPLRIFDNGKSTFMQFPNNNALIPSIYAVNTNGTESLLRHRLENEYVVVDSIEYQFALRYKSDLTCIFNEMLLLNEKNN